MFLHCLPKATKPLPGISVGLGEERVFYPAHNSGMPTTVFLPQEQRGFCSHPVLPQHGVVPCILPAGRFPTSSPQADGFCMYPYLRCRSRVLPWLWHRGSAAPLLMALRLLPHLQTRSKDLEGASLPVSQLQPTASFLWSCFTQETFFRHLPCPSLSYEHPVEAAIGSL